MPCARARCSTAHLSRAGVVGVLQELVEHAWALGVLPHDVLEPRRQRLALAEGLRATGRAGRGTRERHGQGHGFGTPAEEGAAAALRPGRRSRRVRHARVDEGLAYGAASTVA